MSDNLSVKDGTGTLVQVKTKEVTAGLHLEQSLMSDATGTPHSSSNPFPVKSRAEGSVNVRGFTTFTSAQALALSGKYPYMLRIKTSDGGAGVLLITGIDGTGDLVTVLNGDAIPGGPASVGGTGTTNIEKVSAFYTAE